MYKLFLRPILFKFSPEKAHHIAFSGLRFAATIPGVKSLLSNCYRVKDQRLERTIAGIRFENPVGLAAGLDKNASLFDELSLLGFGFVEVGTVTPVGQEGNPKPRLFRLPKDAALINRMGFNNVGVKAMVQRLKKRKTTIVIGGNIGKNKVTPNEEALNDYLTCFEELFPYVDYFVVNVSSPNTPNLRDLQDKEPLTKLLNELMQANATKAKQKPIFLKIAPDLSDNQLLEIIEIVQSTKIHGVVATNTTIQREGLRTPLSKVEAMGNGGLSGKPLRNRSIEVVRFLAEKSAKSFPIIGVGGIFSADDALEMLAAGADLVQLYTGFIYEGPSIIKEINRRIIESTVKH